MVYFSVFRISALLLWLIPLCTALRTRPRCSRHIYLRLIYSPESVNTFYLLLFFLIVCKTRPIVRVRIRRIVIRIRIRHAAIRVRVVTRPKHHTGAEGNPPFVQRTFWNYGRFGPAGPCAPIPIHTSSLDYARIAAALYSATLSAKTIFPLKARRDPPFALAPDESPLAYAHDTPPLAYALLPDRSTTRLFPVCQ